MNFIKEAFISGLVEGLNDIYQPITNLINDALWRTTGKDIYDLRKHINPLLWESATTALQSAPIGFLPGALYGYLTDKGALKSGLIGAGLAGGLGAGAGFTNVYPDYKAFVEYQKNPEKFMGKYRLYEQDKDNPKMTLMSANTNVNKDWNALNNPAIYSFFSFGKDPSLGEYYKKKYPDKANELIFKNIMNRMKHFGAHNTPPELIEKIKEYVKSGINEVQSYAAPIDNENFYFPWNNSWERALKQFNEQ